MALFNLTVNGERRTADVQPDTPLLWVLRDTLGLTGTKYGCGMGLCGAYGALGWRGSPLLPNAGRLCGREEDHHHRGSLARSQPSGPESLDCRAGHSVRVLPVGADYASCCTARTKPASQPRTN
jgi:hypothetical protein